MSRLFGRLERRIYKESWRGQVAIDTGELIWQEYYDAFSYLKKEEVRPLCHPRKLLHRRSSGKAIVLVHGLTDSPYAMLAIARYFHEKLGYDVYLPLLQCHGLKDANGMRGVSLAAWKENVRFAIDTASRDGARLSIGGLSTGGTLSFYFASLDARVNGELYLFSAAFGLYGWKGNVLSPFVEGFLKLPFIPYCTNSLSLISDNPYRYSRVPLIAARELVFLIDENAMILQEMRKKPADMKIFSAWSEADRVVRVDLLAGFGTIVSSGYFVSYVLPLAAEVPHAGVVLENAVYGLDYMPGDPPVETANPHFHLMMESLARFEGQKSSG
jgi:pimeloyl-ACP methyl ester carboxylesterase